MGQLQCTFSVCCYKIAEAEAAVSVNEEKWLVMHVHVQLRLDELQCVLVWLHNGTSRCAALILLSIWCWLIFCSAQPAEQQWNAAVLLHAMHVCWHSTVPLFCL
jgi:hypothetical protein